jgi:hypothetical protein
VDPAIACLAVVLMEDWRSAVKRDGLMTVPAGGVVCLARALAIASSLTCATLPCAFFLVVGFLYFRVTLFCEYLLIQQTKRARFSLFSLNKSCSRK